MSGIAVRGCGDFWLRKGAKMGEYLELGREV